MFGIPHSEDWDNWLAGDCCSDILILLLMLASDWSRASILTSDWLTREQWGHFSWTLPQNTGHQSPLTSYHCAINKRIMFPSRKISSYERVLLSIKEYSIPSTKIRLKNCGVIFLDLLKHIESIITLLWPHPLTDVSVMSVQELSSQSEARKVSYPPIRGQKCVPLTNQRPWQIRQSDDIWCLSSSVISGACDQTGDGGSSSEVTGC